MAAVRARRPAASGRGRRAKAAPPAMPMPRLAQIKLGGGLSADDVKVTGKSLVLALTGAVFFLGVAIAGAAWLGSSLFDAREAFARSADAAAAGVGFEIDVIDVAAMPNAPQLSDARIAEVRGLIVPDGRHSILALDPAKVKARVEGLDWVASVRVRRLWPSTLRVEITRRQAYALWEEGDQLSVIDANGERLLAERAANHAHLPRVVGAGAGPAAEPLLIALEGLPNVRARLTQLVRIGDRRWNVELASGATIALPEDGAPQALVRLEALQADYNLLDRPVALLDMRTPGRLAVRVHPALDGGLRPTLLGGA